MQPVKIVSCLVISLALSLTAYAGSILTVGSGSEQYNSLQAAIDVAADGDTIRISEGTYTSAPLWVSGKTNLIIEAASGAAVTLKETTPVASDGFFRIHASTNLTLRGDSPGKRLVIQDSGNNCCLESSMWGTNTGITIENVEFAGTHGGYYTVIAGGTEVFTNCKWSASGRPLEVTGADGQPVSDVTLNDCLLAPVGADFGILHEGINGMVKLNRCTIDGASASGTFVALALNEASSPQTLEVTDSTFKNLHLAYDDYGTAAANGAQKQVIFVNPTFESCTGGIQSYKGVNVTLQGKDAQHKANLAGSSVNVWFANVVKGTLTLQDLITAPSQGLGLVATVTGPTNNPVTINLNRCVFANGTQLADNGTAGGTSTVTINATNCIFEGSVRPFLDTSSTVQDAITLTHCTMFPLEGQAGLDYMVSSDNDVLTGNYSIFDANGQNSVNSLIALGGVKNIIREASFTTFGGATPGDTLVADPLLDATGHLQSGSPAIDAAGGSTLNVDSDGKARPQGLAADIGADEFAALNAARSSWSLY